MGCKSPASSEKDVACKLCPWEEAAGSVDDVGQTQAFLRGPAVGTTAQHLAWICPGSWQAWAQAILSLIRAGLGWCPVASVCPLSGLPPYCWSPVWKPEETGPGSPLADVQLSQTKHQHGIQGLPLSLLGSWAETVLDSCTNLCTPLYICYIECIYVGNMLASVCRCCVSCAAQHRALTWP